MSIVTAHVSFGMPEMCVLLFDYHFGQLVCLGTLKMGFRCEVLAKNSIMSRYPECGKNWVAVKLFKEILNRNMISEIVMLYCSNLNGKSEKELRLSIPVVADFVVHYCKLLSCLGINRSHDSSGLIHEKFLDNFVSQTG